MFQNMDGNIKHRWGTFKIFMIFDECHSISEMVEIRGIVTIEH